MPNAKRAHYPTPTDIEAAIQSFKDRKPVKYEIHMDSRGLLWGMFFSLILWAVFLGLLVQGLRP